MVAKLEDGSCRLNARPTNSGVVRLLESPDEGVDGRISNAGGLNDGAVEDKDGDGTQKVDIVEIVDIVALERQHTIFLSPCEFWMHAHH